MAASDASEAIRQVRAAIRALRAHIVELRLDFLKSCADIDTLFRWLARQKRLPDIIATCRRIHGGGKFRGSAADEIKILERAVEVGCGWCDVEIETARQLGADQLKRQLAPARLLVSAHDFKRLPEKPLAVLKSLDAYRADAVKIAATCHSFAEIRRLLMLLRRRRDLVLIPMGEDMLAARVLALREGSALAYAPVAQSTAPGQAGLDEIGRVYRLRRRFGKSNEGPDLHTDLYGVIGDPIGHSLSPLMHNAAFALRRKNAMYLPFRVRALADFVAAAKHFRIAGFSVTIPHKQRILRYLDDCDPLASEVGAVNTVVVRAGKLCGYNTDFIGLLRAIERRLPLSSSSVLLVGAGGVARAAAFALSRAGAKVSIWARRPQRSQSLARAVGGEAIERSEIVRRSFDAIVNCTPVGMYPRGGSPLEARELNCRLVMDLIYRPLKTELMRRAERRGIETISGVEMFVAQGAAQWELWMGEPAPKNAMRRVVLAALENEERVLRR